jgi:phosphatidylinositol alpha-mannosyltransferase
VSAAHAQSRRDKTRAHTGVLAGVLTLAVLAALITLAVVNLDLAAVGRAIGHLNVGWIVLAVVLMAGAFYARGESWFAVLGAAVPAERLDRGTVRRALLIGMAGSAVAPGRLGEGARAWVVARRLGQPTRTLATVLGTVVSQTFLNLLALALLAIAAVLDSSLGRARLAAVVTVVVLPGALVLALALGRGMLRKVTSSARVGWLKTAAGWCLKQLIRFRRGLAVFRQPVPALHATGAQLGAWSLQLGACYVVMLALGLGHRANLAAAAAVLLAVNVTAIVPVTPSNVGVFQAACIAVLHPFGIEANHALAYGLVLQAVEVFDALALGIPALLREGLPWGELRRQARRLAEARAEH